ncbi:hypothetical protein NDU88_000194 [Pleurodeles waltl]|uniref:MHC class I antigen n=1 Tax=Pleurodeles waltl TaxID=8319 RepID=A0AAV7WEQ9_PLEWA|nr:hypothetical protein NDU88_000194 [Pleurodeles waltl]
MTMEMRFWTQYGCLEVLPVRDPTTGKQQDSLTSFVGQCFVDDNGNEVLETIWLLRSPAGKRSDNWKATRISKYANACF